MEITSSASNLPQIRLDVPARDLNALPLRNGQTVTALVQSSADDGSVTLNINGKLLQANSSLQLLQGMSLKLTVERENQQVLLRVSPEEQQRLVQQQALRQLLPRQDSLKPLLETLAKLLPRTDEGAPRPQGHTSAPASEAGATGSKPALQTPPAFEQIQKLALQLLRQVATPQALSEAPALKQIISHSGVFLEQQLGATTTSGYSPDKDIKVILLRLAALLRQAIAIPVDGRAVKKAANTAQQLQLANTETLLQLQKQAEAGLARIQINQLGNAAGMQQGDERPLILELPVFNPQQQQTELLHLKIQREKNRHGDSSQDCWSVTLHLSPADFGEIQGIVSLTEKRVGISFWCARESTSELFREQLEFLTQRLQEQGLEVGRCSAHKGLPVSRKADQENDFLTLIDIKA